MCSTSTPHYLRSPDYRGCITVLGGQTWSALHSRAWNVGRAIGSLIVSFPPPGLPLRLRFYQAPGGIGEMFLDGDAGKEFALIKGHKGFVRTAMAHGVPLVPVYGEHVVNSTHPLEVGRE